MNKREEAEHLNLILKNGTFQEKKLVVTHLRNKALTLLAPIQKAVPRSLPEHIMETSRAKGISLDWDLHCYESVLEFCHQLKGLAREVSTLQKRAATLLKVCSHTLEEGTVSDIDRERIVAAYAALDDEAVELSIKHRKTQSENARKPRNKRYEERTIYDLIQDLAKRHRDEEPREIWPHLKAEIEEWTGDCKVTNDENEETYHYWLGETTQKISYSRFRKRLADIRRIVL